MARKSIKREVSTPITNGMSNNDVVEIKSLLRYPPHGDSDTTVDPDILMADKLSGEVNDLNGINEVQGREYEPSPATTPQEPLDASSVLSDNGLDILCKGVKELVQAIQKLRDLGIEDLGLPLPKIVVVGDQSTGKSSLIEGMSGIKVPRDAGTCTRCPLEINLSESASNNDTWTCKVSLCKKYIYQGRQSKATRNQPLGPWIAQDNEIIQFATLKSKDQVVETLRLAQLATLNPSSPYTNYMPGQANLGGGRQVQFSPNVVRLEISGPKLPNLSFFDLPGVINVSEVAEEEYLVKLVRNLVCEYIKEDNCINILAIPMTDDPANSTAFDLIRKLKAEARTVGVLTKPDRIQSGESWDQWTSILESQKFKLGFCYFVVKNNPDTRIDNATARLEEQAFFDQHPWNTEMNEYQARFGTFKLQTSLSQMLTAQIKTSLPRIISQVEQKSANIETELSKIPEPPVGNLPMKILEKIIAFEREVGLQIGSGSQSHPFLKSWKEAAIDFRKCLVDRRPILQLTDHTAMPIRNIQEYSNTEQLPSTPTPPRHRASEDVISIDSEDNDLSLSSRKRRQKPKVETSSAKRTKSTIPSDIPMYGSTNSSLDRRFARRFGLNEIRGMIQDAYIGLPGEIHPEATERMIRLSLASWEEPVDRFLDLTEEICQDMINEQVAKIFRCWESTQVYNRILGICELFLKEALNHQRRVVERAQHLELHTITTLNVETLSWHCDKAHLEIKDARKKARANELLKKQELKSAKILTGTAREEQLAKITDTQLGPDIFFKEVELMGTVRGYYEYALSRFVDNVGQGIQGELFVKCHIELGPRLREEIGLEEGDANERCAILLEVDVENRERRMQLKKEKGKIDEAQSWLERLTEGGVEELS